MNRRVLWALGFLIVFLFCWYFWPRPKVLVIGSIPPSAMTGPKEAPAGNRILAGYGDPTAKPEEDLTLMSRALLNFTTLVKGEDPLPLGANEEIAAALMGRRRSQLVFLQKPTPALNDANQLIDRWGTPLYFHAASKDRIDIRSAGPDRVLWTQDDLHRNSDGHFRRGAELLPDSLFQK